MTPAEIWAALAAVIRAIPQSGLLVAVIAALLCGWTGGYLVRRHIVFGRFLSAFSTIALAGILVTVVLQMSRLDPKMDFAVPELGLPQQVVAGGETRIPMADDGHFWLRAEVNGVPVAFMIDTGATLTAVSSDVAVQAGLKPRRGGIPIMLDTANGTIAAQVVTIGTMRFGNIETSGLDAVTADNFRDTNVIGMNLLSRLKGWRVEDNTMILVPKVPLAAAGEG